MALSTSNETNPNERMGLQLRSEGVVSSSLEALTLLANHKAEYLRLVTTDTYFYDLALFIGSIGEHEESQET